ncbi:MAG: prepilin-type N-terminal cleavage/methylation domain-containing protein [Phycisphaerae bacterium]|nr:prepilin-type N-terminal cleavage/methylation domain-containing protein [Phycisphaerae bacterium]
MNRHGFSLIELLVVIAVISLLMGALSPGLWSARQQAQAVWCTSNMKQLSLALMIYEEANGRFPYAFDDRMGQPIPNGGHPGDPLCDNMGIWWLHQLEGFIDAILDRNSPAWCAARKVKDRGLEANILLGNYGVNRVILTDLQGPAGGEFVGPPLGLKQIRHPSAVLLITDSGYSQISWYGAADNVVQRFENVNREQAFYVPGLSINVNRTFPPLFHEDAVKGRHPRRTINVTYADGHVNRAKAESLLVEEIGGGWANRSPLWVP